MLSCFLKLINNIQEVPTGEVINGKPDIGSFRQGIFDLGFNLSDFGSTKYFNGKLSELDIEIFGTSKTYRD